MALSIGEEIGGYRIEAIAGNGGMGVVYRATHVELARPAALKIITPALADDPEFRARFEREARLAAALDHPHVVPVYEAGRRDGRPFIAMRWIDGEDLGFLLARDGALEPRRALAILRQVASALDAAHARGLVHRDVKPGNILVTEHPGGAPHVYLGDFGLARADGATSITAGVAPLGTPSFSAPEQIEAGESAPAADVYALGCVAFAMLTGRPPFTRGDAMATLWAHVHESPPRASEANPELPAGVDAVLGRALDKRPAARFTRAGELASALGAVIEDGREAPAPVAAPARTDDERTPARAPLLPAPGTLPRAADPPTPVTGPPGSARTARLFGPGYDERARSTAKRRGAADPKASRRRPRDAEPPAPAPRRRRGGAALRAIAALGVATALAVGALFALGQNGDSPVAPPEPAEAAEAEPTGATVRCDGSTCRQDGREVTPPIDGGPCGAGANWTRLDAGGSTPLLACLPGEDGTGASGALLRPTSAPDLLDARLDLAERFLDAAGVEHEAEGGGAFGIVDRSNWVVCATAPAAGDPLGPDEAMVLFVERSC